MKIPPAFLISFYAILTYCQTEATTRYYLTDYCDSDIDLSDITDDSGEDLGKFVLYSQRGYYYYNDIDCDVTITASDPENYVLLHFERFNLEINYDTGFCYDKLEINSYYERLTPGGGVCGSITPDDYLAYRQAKLSFKTDSSLFSTGFKILVAEVIRGVDSGIDCDESSHYLCDNGHCIDIDEDPYADYTVSDYCGDDDYVQGEDSIEEEVLSEVVIIVIGVIVGVVAIAIIAGVVFGIISCMNSKPIAVAPINTVSTTVTATIPPPYQQQPPPYHQLVPQPPPPYSTNRVHPTSHPSVHGSNLPPLSGHQQQQLQFQNQPQQQSFPPSQAPASDFAVVPEAFNYNPPPQATTQM